ncbi:3612_t:CDS:2, partial [Rhizophagus irregularis]
VLSQSNPNAEIQNLPNIQAIHSLPDPIQNPQTTKRTKRTTCTQELSFLEPLVNDTSEENINNAIQQLNNWNIANNQTENMWDRQRVIKWVQTRTQAGTYLDFSFKTNIKMDFFDETDVSEWTCRLKQIVADSDSNSMHGETSQYIIDNWKGQLRFGQTGSLGHTKSTELDQKCETNSSENELIQKNINKREIIIKEHYNEILKSALVQDQILTTTLTKRLADFSNNHKENRSKK